MNRYFFKFSLILFLGIVIGLCVYFQVNGNKNFEDQEAYQYLEELHEIEKKELNGIGIANSLIKLCYEVNKFHAPDIGNSIHELARSEISFRELSANLSMYNDAIAFAAADISDFYEVYSEHRINCLSKIVEVSLSESAKLDFSDLLAKKTRNEAKAEKALKELQIICIAFAKEYSHYFNNDQKNAIYQELFRYFKCDIIEYEKKLRLSKGDKPITMHCTQWPQIILYKSLVSDC